MDSRIREKLKAIQDALGKQEDHFAQVNVRTGYGGLVLFYLRYWEFTGDERFFEGALRLLGTIFEKINSRDPGSTTDILELGCLLIHLEQQELIDREEIEDMLVQVDDIAGGHIKKCIDSGNIDPVNGMLSAGIYFLKRSSQSGSRAEVHISLIIDFLTQAAQYDSPGLNYWFSNFRGVTEVELGITHGVSGVLNFLLHIYTKEIEVARVRPLIEGAVAFLKAQQFKDTEDGPFFPLAMGGQQDSGYPCLAYGDFGVLFALLSAGKIMNDAALCKEANRILEYYAAVREPARHKNIADATVIYGASGVATLFYKFYSVTGLAIYREAAEYWTEKILDFAIHDNSYAGFESYWNFIYPKTRVSFTEGICGIGITLIDTLDKKNQDYLQFVNYY
jgi:lantibiotic biosynthesis protein